MRTKENVVRAVVMAALLQCARSDGGENDNDVSYALISVNDIVAKGRGVDISSFDAQATAIDEFGRVTGWYRDVGYGECFSFAWSVQSGFTIEGLAPSDDDFGSADDEAWRQAISGPKLYNDVEAVSASGLRVGTSSDIYRGAEDCVAVTWDHDGSWSILPTPNASQGWAMSVSDDGGYVGGSVVVPQAGTGNPMQVAAVWRDGAQVALSVRSDTTWVTSINASGQAIFLGMTDQSASVSSIALPLSSAPMQFVPPVSEFERLYRYESGTFVPLSETGLGTDNVYVLSHGWAPGLRDEVDAQAAPLAWDMHAGWYNSLASSILSDDPSATIIGYTWIDESATHTSIAPHLSQAMTLQSGERLANLLVAAGIKDGITMIGHSHGAAVSTYGTVRLEELGVDVAALYLLDSPETSMTLAGIGSYVSGGSNRLHGVLDSFDERFGIGTAEGETRLINAYSEFGEAYRIEGAVNIAIDTSGTEGASPRHHEPIDWLSGEGLISIAPGHYAQIDGTPGLISAAAADRVELLSSVATLLVVDTTGANVEATSLSDVWNLTLAESSPASWTAVFEVDADHAHALWSVDLGVETIIAGDDDWLGVWIDGDPYSLSSIDEGHAWQGTIDVGSLLPGLHELTVYVHSGGDRNAVVNVHGLSVWSVSPAAVPEPGRAFLAVVGSVVMLARRRRR
jgi:hypothetical protein